MKIDKLKSEAPFNELFLIDKDVLKSITEDMKENGFDTATPIIIWEGKDIIIDGHTRHQACLNLSIEDIPIHEIHFVNKDEALDYAVHCQRDRRNLDDFEVLNLVDVLDKWRKTNWGGDRKSSASFEALDNCNKTKQLPIIKPTEDEVLSTVSKLENRVRKPKLSKPKPKPQKTSIPLAKKIGVSATKVEKARTVLDHAIDTGIYIPCSNGKNLMWERAEKIITAYENY